MREKRNIFKYDLIRRRWLCVAFAAITFPSGFACGQANFPTHSDNIEWVSPSSDGNQFDEHTAEAQAGGTINVNLPTEEFETRSNQLQPVLSQPSSGQFNGMVRQADFTQPIQEISDPPATSSAGLAATVPAATEGVTKLLGSFAGEDGLGGKIKSTFTQIDFPKVAGSLAIVLGVYFAFVWITRQFSGGRIGGLPTEVVEVLGVAPFGPKKSLQLVRLGSKLLLLLHSPEGTTTIGEISDSEEVEYLSSVCHGRPTQRRRGRRTANQNQSIIAPTPPTDTSPQKSNRTPEVTIPAKDLENVVRQLATAAKTGGAGGGNVFEA